MEWLSPKMARGRRTLAAVGVAIALGALAWTQLGAGAGRDEPVAVPVAPEPTPSGEADEPPLPGADMQFSRGLLAEAARAELDARGLLIDFGTADQHKYTRGGWRTGWGDNRRDDDGTSVGVVAERTATLHVMLRGAPKQIVARIRSDVPDQRVAFSHDGRELGSADVTAEWSAIRIPAADLPETGRAVLTLELAHPRDDGPAAEIDWIWLRSDTDDPTATPAPIPRVAPVELGGRARRSLVAPDDRTYSYYLEPPADAKLVLRYGSTEPVRFTVRATTADGATHELFEATAEPNTWQPAAIDLSELGGRALRLDLATTGPAALTGWAEPELYVPRSPAAAGAPAPRPAQNVIFIVMDTTRADAFGMIDADTVVHTPRFDALAERSTRFVNAYNNENWTKPSVTTMLTGLYPHTHDAQWATSELSDQLQLLPELLSEHGITTVGIVANAVVSEKFGFGQGWDSFDNQARTNRGSAADIYGDAIAWLDEHHAEGRFFLYLQSVDPHTTYEVDRAYSERYYPGTYTGKIGDSFSKDEQFDISASKLRISDDDLAWIKALYYGEITYQDEYIGMLLDKVEDLGLLDDTIVIITNDHGEELHEHGKMGHGWTLFEEQLRAPLLVHYPPLFPADSDVTEVIEHVDLAPTIVDALGLPPMPEAEGLSLLPLMAGNPARQRPYYAVIDFRKNDRAVRVGRWKLAVDADDDWTALYDLVDDPGEAADRRDDRELAGRLCEIYLGEGLATPDKVQRLQDLSSKRQFHAAEAELDPETRAQLEALGYLGGSQGE